MRQLRVLNLLALGASVTILAACGGGGDGGASPTSGGGSLGAGTPAGGSTGSGSTPAAANYSSSFVGNETGEASFVLTASKPNHLDVNDKFTLTKTTQLWAFVATQFTSKVYVLDTPNAQAFLNGQAFQGVLLNSNGGDAMTFPVLAAGTYYIGTVPGQAVTSNYSNNVYHEVAYGRALNEWVENGNIPMTASGEKGTWKSQGFTTPPTGDWRAYIETEGYGGKFMIMDDAQYNSFVAANPSGYTGSAYSFLLACGNQDGGAQIEIECELKLKSGTSYHLLYLNDTSSWGGGAANIQFYRPQ